VSAFESVFPNDKIYSDVKKLIATSSLPSEEGREAASDLIEQLRPGGDDKSTGRLLTSPKPLQYTGPDHQVRNQLQSNATVVLPGNREASLLPEMLREVLSIADDLRISEKEALTLYAAASQQPIRTMLEDRLDESLIDRAMSSHEENAGMGPVVFGTNVVKAAKELYFFERQQLLRTILLLAQSRIEASQQPWGQLVLHASDNLLQNNLISNLITLIRDWTKLITRIEKQLARNEATEANSFSTLPRDRKKKFHFDSVHLMFALQERYTAAECLFYFAYHTQYTAKEVGEMIDVIKDLTNGVEGDNGLLLLNPFHDVPSPYENRPQVDQAWAQFHSSLPPLKEKGHLKWEQELVKNVSKTSKPQLLHCVSALVMACISALDAKQVLHDRDTHMDNSIGSVSTARISPTTFAPRSSDLLICCTLSCKRETCYIPRKIHRSIATPFIAVLHRQVVATGKEEISGD
jgi:hypothetical protein